MQLDENVIYKQQELCNAVPAELDLFIYSSGCEMAQKLEDGQGQTL